MRKSLNDDWPIGTPGVFEVQNGMVRGKRILRAWRNPGGRVWMATERLPSGEYFGCAVRLEVSWTCYWRDDITHPRDGMVELPAEKVVLVSNFGLARNAAAHSGDKQPDGARGQGDGAVQDRDSATVVVRNSEINGKPIIGAWAASEARIWFLATDCDEEKYYGYFVALDEVWGPLSHLGFDTGRCCHWEVEREVPWLVTNLAEPLRVRPVEAHDASTTPAASGLSEDDKEVIWRGRSDRKNRTN